MIKQPEFIQLPKQVIKQPGLQLSDALLYGHILCFSSLKDGCTASNATLSKFSGVGERQVQRSLKKMEAWGLIRLKYNAKKNLRTSIEPIYTIGIKKA